jgi:hypothetical protein
MRLKQIIISGYRGISNAPDEELKLTDLGARNVFIGQNNGGKSTVYRFLLLAVQHLVGLGDSFPHNAISLPILTLAATLADPHRADALADPTLFWKHKATEAAGTLVFTSPGEDFARVEESGLGGGLVRQGEWRLSVRILATGGDSGIIIASPQAWIEAREGWFDVARQVGTQQNTDVEELNASGEYAKRHGKGSPFVIGAQSLVKPVKDWAAAARFFEPFRALRPRPTLPQPEQGNQQPDDGSGVLARLFEWQNNHNVAPAFHKFRDRFKARLNRLFDRPYAELMLRSDPSVDLSLTLEGDEAIPIPLRSMGSGIAQMVIILASLEADAMESGKPRHYHIEEPELHLHPRLLRRFMAQLAEYKNTQFFISSHSNVILDSVEEGDRVYWFSQEPAGNCIARPVSEIVTQHALLDALGVTGSALLQTNCVIWVEGPSDRLYLRHWLKEAAKGERLLEGADYAFVFYGGKVLSHFGFEVEDSDLDTRLIPMLAISRYAAVVMDRDRAPAQPEAPLSDTKQKICAEAAKDRRHRLACVTKGREIENDVPLPALKEGLATKLGVEVARLDGLVLTGRNRYPKEVVAHLGLTGPAAETAERKLADKVGLASDVLARLEAQKGKTLTPRPGYVDSLFEFIRSSRVE